MEVVFAAPQHAFASALEAEIGDLDGLSIHRGSILDLECDALVSPANSFGFMDGGIDQAYVAHFGEKVQTRVRERILYDHQGELCVGSAVFVPTDDSRIPFLIAAPTMRVPMWLGAETVNPFLATRAAVLLVREGMADRIRRIAIPGMGTGVGGVPFEVSARQMVQAVVRFRDGQYMLPRSWSEATEDHVRLYSDEVTPLQR